MNSEFRHVISKNFVNSNFFIFYFYCFRFLVFSKINGIQTDPVSTSQSYPLLATSHHNDQRPTPISHHNPTHFLFFLSLSLFLNSALLATISTHPPADQRPTFSRTKNNHQIHALLTKAIFKNISQNPHIDLISTTISQFYSHGDGENQTTRSH